MMNDLPLICKHCSKPIDDHEIDELSECLQHCALEIEELISMVQTQKKL